MREDDKTYEALGVTFEAHKRIRVVQTFSNRVEELVITKISKYPIGSATNTEVVKRMGNIARGTTIRANTYHVSEESRIAVASVLYGIGVESRGFDSIDKQVIYRALRGEL